MSVGEQREISWGSNIPTINAEDDDGDNDERRGVLSVIKKEEKKKKRRFRSRSSPRLQLEDYFDSCLRWLRRKKILHPAIIHYQHPRKNSEAKKTS